MIGENIGGCGKNIYTNRAKKSEMWIKNFQLEYKNGKNFPFKNVDK